MNSPKAIFVALGGLKPFAIQNIELAMEWCQSGRVVVIGDRAGLRHLPHGVTPVSIDSLVTDKRRAALGQQLRSCGANTRWRNGYWLSILVRFEALRRYGAAFPDDGPIFHIENDVATFLTDRVVQEICRSSEHGVRVPYLDSEQACAGILWARDGQSLSLTCAYIVESVAAGDERSDMFALGSLQTRGEVGQLPVRFKDPEIALKSAGEASAGNREEMHLVFDSVVVGQYLFGSDPRNSQGVSVPGYRFVKGGFDPCHLSNWRLEKCSDGNTRVVADEGDGVVAFASLHIHSKRTIPNVVRDAAEWGQVLDWANGISRPLLDIRLSKVIFSMIFVRLSPLKQRLNKLAKRSGMTSRINAASEES